MNLMVVLFVIKGLCDQTSKQLQNVGHYSGKRRREKNFRITGHLSTDIPLFFQIPKAIADVPCLKESLMYGIGGMALTGATYNFTTSKNPFASKYFLGLYPLIFFGTW